MLDPDESTNESEQATIDSETAEPTSDTPAGAKALAEGRRSDAGSSVSAGAALFSAPSSTPDAEPQPSEKPAVAPSAGLLFKAPDPSLAPPRPKHDDSESDDDSDGDLDCGDHRGDGKNNQRKNNQRKNNQRDDDRRDDDRRENNQRDDDRRENNQRDDNRRENNQRDDDDDSDDGDTPRRRKRSRGGRRRRKGSDPDSGDQGDNDGSDNDDADDDGPQGRRRRKRVRQGESADSNPDDPQGTVVKVREGRSAEDEITGVTGSTRLEAKKQRRREGREAGRRRAPIVTESEFLARREAVSREMVIRQHPEFAQIAVLEDDVLVEHYVSRESQTSIIGNVYLGKVQNVLPSMEAAFVDIGQGRNAVLYAGEVDWSSLAGGKPRKIEELLSPGQPILVQATKDPVGQKGARLTSQVSLPGRFLVLVPGGQTSGISRKLPDTERSRLKALLKDVVPDDIGVIVRTAAEGATEDQLTRDVTGLTARWKDIEAKVEAGQAPQSLYTEPDLMIKVVRDLFNEDFSKLVVDGDDAWDNVHGYIGHVAPDLVDRLERWTGDKPAFEAYRIDEQITKALDTKVWLPSGGSLIIDRTEAMTVVDVNTGKFTGSGGNLEETVTKNNLEAAEEIVRQLRLRDIGGIIVIDFIDMVLESNRDLVLRRLVECLGRDRTRHQVAEVTSLGLVQMTRKRIGTGLLESFATTCEHCKGTGEVIHAEPIEPKKSEDNSKRRRSRGGKGRKGGDHKNGEDNGSNDDGDDQGQGQNKDQGQAKGQGPNDKNQGGKSGKGDRSGKGRRSPQDDGQKNRREGGTDDNGGEPPRGKGERKVTDDADGGAADPVTPDEWAFAADPDPGDAPD